MDDYETIQTPQTSVQRFPSADDSAKCQRYATKVFSRILDSSSECDQALKERIAKAVRVLSQTRSTETAVLQTNPADNVRRLASRVVRRLGLRS